MSDVQITPWRISRLSRVDDFSESVFFVGSGTLGVRGFGAWERKKSPKDHAIFRAGLFSLLKPGLTDMVQLPDALTLIPLGETPEGDVLQELDMRTGVLTQSWETPRARLSMTRTACRADGRLLMQRLMVRALEPMRLRVMAVADAMVANLPVHDDQTVQSDETARMLALDALDEHHMRLHTLDKGKPVTVRWELLCSRETDRKVTFGEQAVCDVRSVDLTAGEEFTIEKRVYLDAGEETSAESSPEDPWQAGAACWEALWRDCDIEVDADDPSMQGALRYNIFQMLCSDGGGDPHVSIGARGLTHGRYKGNTFWDTEIFLMPFFLWTQPETAGRLIRYRTDRLDDARALARKQNLSGARFPWMCSDTGAEQCESWDIGLCETHITADVAYAAARYAQVTGDEAFLRGKGAELFSETARYWRSRLTYEPDKDRYSSFFVKGPDEYCGAAVNNTYTNYLAKYNLELAVKYGGTDEEEARLNQAVADRITLLYDDARGVFLQDETLNRLPPFPGKDGDAPSYKSVCFDRMQRYRAIKQADLVLLMTLFPSDFTNEQKLAVFREYEPITVHDSTLSYGVHAQLALRLGLWDKAEDYLRKGLYLDLRNIMGNTGSEGLHMAALGAAWQAAALGAVGLWGDERGITVSPMLPPGIREIKMSAVYRGKRYRICATRDGAVITEEV